MKSAAPAVAPVNVESPCAVTRSTGQIASIRAFGGSAGMEKLPHCTTHAVGLSPVMTIVPELNVPVALPSPGPGVAATVVGNAQAIDWPAASGTGGSAAADPLTAIAGGASDGRSDQK